MIEISSNFKGIAIVQFPEQINIFKEYFSKEKIEENNILWMAITDTALLFLEKEKVKISRITDFYDYNTLHHYIFDKSYESLAKITKKLDKKIFTNYPKIKKYDMVFSQFAFYYLRTWCDSIESRIYEFLALKKQLGIIMDIYYVPFKEPLFSYPSYPYYTHHSLDLEINLVFKDKNLIKVGHYDPKNSISGYRSELESETISKRFKDDPIPVSFIRRGNNFLQRIFSKKHILCIGVCWRDFFGELKNFDTIDDIPKFGVKNFDVRDIVNNSLQPHDFEIMGVSYQEYYKKILTDTIDSFLQSVFKTIKFYEKKPKPITWKCILSTGFNTFELKALAKIFIFYNKKVCCFHHGSLGILSDKLNAFLEYPFVTDYFVWGPQVKKQIKQEGNFDKINIHSIGSPQVNYIKRKILSRKKNLSHKKTLKPLIIYHVQCVNDGLRVTLDHPPGIIDFNQQKELINSILKINVDFDLILKGHPSCEGYHSALRFLFKDDPRVHFVSSLPLENFLLEGNYFITCTPSTSLLQAMSCGLKSYCLINSEFYTDDCKKYLLQDGVLFNNCNNLVAVLHQDLKKHEKKEVPLNYLNKSFFLEKYCNSFNDTLSYKKILNFIKKI